MATLHPTALRRIYNLNVTGNLSARQTVVLAHRFGSDQTAWRHQAAALGADYRLVLFDHLGCGQADTSAFNPLVYNSLERFSADVLDILRALELERVIFIGHSVSAMLGMLAALAEPQRIARLVFVGASPRYLNETGYVGGFELADLNSMYKVMAQSYLDWANGFAPLVMGNAGDPSLGREFARTLSGMRPDMAQSIARVIFEADYRAQLPLVTQPVLILQPNRDVAVPLAVGAYLAARLPHNQLRILDAEGHFPHLSAPDEVNAAICAWLADA
jgi:sigma-B regulation protein RsbQ